MAAETLIQVKAREACFWWANLLSKIYGKPNDKNKIEIECCTVNHQLYDSIYSAGPTQDKLLWIGIYSVRKMLNTNEVTKLNWIEKQYQLAGCLSKSAGYADVLLKTKYAQN